MKSIKHVIPIVLCLTAFSAQAQEQEQLKDEQKDLAELSLEELMNVPINSASKKDETLFDAPLSSYTITRTDIERAGSTSIMEALRLAPGLIVREQTNGVYDIHIRGFDNILRTAGDYTKGNLITLVMIDNRPVFNNNLGGTFWEALPIDLNDVERIEIVRGPSAPLFGPNAVSGVINIITRKAGENKTLVSATVMAGTPATTIANASVGKNTGKWSFLASGNFQNRERFSSDFYNNATGQFVTGQTLTNEFDTFYPNPNTAMNKWGANGFIGYKASEKVSFDLSLGTQNSDVMKNFVGGNSTRNNTKITANESKSSYANLAIKAANLSIRGSFAMGNDNLNVGSLPNQYEYTGTNVDAEYAIKIGEKVTVTPGASYQSANYNDQDYQQDGSNPDGGYLNGEVNINTLAGFIRTDINFTKKWRVLAAIRADKFSTPDKAYAAYEFASTYKLNDKNIVRAAITRSNSGSFIGYNFLNVIQPTPVPGIAITQQGNENMNLFTINMIEVGYRIQATSKLQFDIDLFHQKAENFTAVLGDEFHALINRVSGYQFYNVPTTAIQKGATLSINFVPSEKVQIKPFITVQSTKTTDLPSSFAIPALDPSLTYSSSTHKNTPSFYGGYYLNYAPNRKINVNVNGYYLAAHRQYDDSDPAANSSTGDIKGKLLVNAKVNWHVTSQFNLFVNGRNALNNKSREFFGTDRLSGLYLIGASYTLN